MRIAIIAPPWLPVPPPAYGGTEAMLDNLARGLRAAGHDVMLYATGDSTCDVPIQWVRQAAAGVLALNSATELHHVVNAYAAVLDWKADIVHDHTLVGPVYGQRFDIPLVTTNHGPFDGELGDLYEAIGSQVPVIAISHHHASTARRIPVAAVVHHGLAVDTVPIGTGQGGYAAFLGRMTPSKGVHIAIQVARATGIPLKIAAKMREPAERSYYERMVAPLLGENVEYLGELNGREKLDLLAGAVCLLNPLAWPEPFGLVMIESLACATPVVATPCGSVPEIVTDGVTGYIRATQPELSEALGRIGALDRALCRKDAQARFSTGRMVGDHLKIYERVLSRHTVGRCVTEPGHNPLAS